MRDTLNIHAASPDEIAAAHRNVHAIWSRGLGVEEHVRLRLQSPKHRWATWYVGCIEEHVVVSLGAYPVRFQLRGTLVPGIAIGSVYTVPEFRRRGYAARLIDFVDQEAASAGIGLSMLYSDIDPNYYARLGYQPCPSWSGWRDVQDAPPSIEPANQLVEIKPAAHLQSLMQLYNGYHGAAPLSIARDRQYWQALQQRFPTEQLFAFVPDGQRAWSGYVRLHTTGSDWRITDYALANERAQTPEELYRAASTLAASHGAARLGGWLPDLPAARTWFELAPRRTEITMFKPLADNLTLDHEAIASTDRFCEVDHV